MAHEDLPRRTPDAHYIPHHRTAAPSIALVIRIANGVDEWAERDRHDPGSSNYR